MSQCAESKVFACSFYGFPAILKQRFVKQYRHEALDQKLREQRTVREARALVRCRKLGVPAPVVYSVDRLQCTIVMERIDGISVRDLFNSCVDATTQASVAKSVLETIGEIVGLLHQGDMIHGDLTTANFLSVGTGGSEHECSIGVVERSQSKPLLKSPTTPHHDVAAPTNAGAQTPTSTSTALSSELIRTAQGNVTRNGIVIIDFGLVSDKNSAEERAVDLYVLERAVMSAHPLLENVEQCILAGYQRTIDAHKGKQTLDRLLAVRARGRKRSMIG